MSIISNITLSEFVQYGVPILTLGLLFIYTIATIFLWRESQFQSQLAISPFLIFEIDEDGKFYIKNLGKSPAFNIKMDELIIFVPMPKQNKIYKLVSKDIGLLESDRKAELQFTSYSGEKQVDIDLTSHLDPKLQNNCNYIFNIIYNNTIGNIYFTKFMTGKDGLKILKINRLSLFQTFLSKIDKIVQRLKLEYWKRFS